MAEANSPKIENQLNLSLDVTEEERERSEALSTGYDPEERTWEVIVKYTGNLREVAGDAVQVTELINEYAILAVPESLLDSLAALPQIEYIEKPHRLYFAIAAGKRASCMTAVQRPPLNLTGRGVLVAVLDSGVDYTHPEFRNADGSTRILALWDQTADGVPPEGYHIGAEFTQEQINNVLFDPGARPLTLDSSGHGTGVLAIAVGNQGVAYESDILAVKLGNPKSDGFPRTTELMQALDYVVKKGLEYGRPLAVNISFGNTYGSHTGTSLLERYMDDVAGLGRTVICVGSGNEGAGAGHMAGKLSMGGEERIELAVGGYELSLSLQLWKQYEDLFSVRLVHPNGTVLGPFYPNPPAQRYRAGRTELLVYYGEPSPYSVNQEIFVDFIPVADYLDSGIWTVILTPERIVDGNFELWLPSHSVTGAATRFLSPVETGTLTIPSTAARVITVGAYNDATGAYADFSGRGLLGYRNVKPSLVAPGVGIRTAVPGGGYREMTGTSFATPFVTGAAALLMEWGIVRGNDPYLYGEKVKAYLQRGARPLPGFRSYPNEQVGWGALCVADSIPRG